MGERSDPITHPGLGAFTPYPQPPGPVVLRWVIATKKTTVLLADDHTVVRQGLRALLSSEEDIEVIGEAENGRRAVLLARENPPDVVLMDVAMPLLNGLEATRQILRLSPATKVLVLTSYGDDELVLQLLDAGVSGYLLKQTAADDLLRAIREVRAGRSFLSPSVARRLRHHSQDAFTNGSSPHKSRELTSREAEVLQLIAEGLSNKQIASELGISVKTVEKHRQQVMNKVGIHEIAGLTRYAISKGMVERAAPGALGLGGSRKLAGIIDPGEDQAA